jgi:cobalt-zinc-cadmium efflux system outer membrane protein
MNKPQWKISTGIRRFEEQDDHAFVVDFTVPLNFKNPNQGIVAAANAKIAQADADKRLAEVHLNTQLFELYQELQHSLHRVESYQNVIIPAISQAAKDSQDAFERGRYSYQEWQAAQSSLLNAREEYLDAMISAHLYVIELERVTGVQLSDLSNTKRNAS